MSGPAKPILYMNVYLGTLVQISAHKIKKMSLFKTRELWSVTNPPNETYASRSLALYPSENLVECKFKTDLILTASLEGILRMYNVILHPNEDANSTANNLLLETNLKLPILQVAVGNFSR